MFRKIVLISFIFCLLIATAAVNAGNPLLPGCYVDAPATVDEGATFTVTVNCNSLLAAYGFEYGTGLTGPVTTAANSYTPGTFATASAAGVLVGTNTLSKYALSRQGLISATGNFTLGSYSVTANSAMTADGTAVFSLQNFKMSTIAGVPITGLVQVDPNATVNIRNINLAFLNGNFGVTSDGSVSWIKNVALTLDGVPYSQASVNSNHFDFTVANGAQYAALSVNAAVDMESHLACSKAYTLADGTNSAATKIGTITLKAGDVVTVSDTAINIQDATAIGAQYGSSSPTGEVDINKDGTVDIYDLVHVGRNYGATQGNCG